MAISKEIIIRLPLFTGLSQKELDEIVRQIPFTLRHHKKGATIVTSGNPCTMLVTITNGQSECSTMADDNSYRMDETIHAIHVIEPDKLFGLEQRYRTTFRAITPCETLEISKESLLNLIGNYLIVRLNYLNIICRDTQKLEHKPWKVRSNDTMQSIVAFIKNRVRHPAGSKRLYIKIIDLAKEINSSRWAVSEALNELARQERIIQRRGMIEIPALQLL